MAKKIRIGSLVSSGGSALISAHEIFNKAYPNMLELYVVTDRECGIENYCRLNNIAHKRIVEKDRAILSKKIADHFDDIGEIDVVVLFFMRIVAEELFKKHMTLNFHPSILPDFPGANAVRQALNAKAEYLGVTLHMVDEILDGGQIIVQTTAKLPAGIEEPEAESLSFCQKIYLTLWLFQNMQDSRILFKWDKKKGFLAKLKGDHIVSLDADIEELYKERITQLGYGKFLNLIIKSK